MLEAACAYWGLGVGDDGGLSGCLDRLDKDIKGKQKAALWRGHRHEQTRLFSIQVGVSVQGYLSCRMGGGVGPLTVTLTLIYVTHNMCD